MNKEASLLETFKEILNIADCYSTDNVVGYLKTFYKDKLDIIEDALRTAEEAEEEQQGLVEDYHDLSLKYCELADKYEEEHKVLEALKNRLDFFADGQKQTISIRHNRLVHGTSLTLSFDNKEEFNRMKEVLK